MSTPTVVLAHGALTDGSGWSPIVLRLQGAGLDVRVPALSNRSLAEDAAYLRASVENISGPVLLVGHSYGATVAGVAGAAENVQGLVLVSGYALAEGEAPRDVQRRFPDAEAMAYLEYVDYPVLNGIIRREVSIAVDEFPFVSALGVPADEAAVLAVTQRPLAADVLAEPASAAAWRTTPTWGVVSTRDRTVNPDAVRFGLERAGARRIVELDAPHLVMRTHPAEVTELVIDAVSQIS